MDDIDETIKNITNTMNQYIDISEESFDLLCEIIATIKNPKNQSYFDNLPERWELISNSWIDRFDDLRKKRKEIK